MDEEKNISGFYIIIISCMYHDLVDLFISNVNCMHVFGMG